MAFAFSSVQHFLAAYLTACARLSRSQSACKRTLSRIGLTYRIVTFVVVGLVVINNMFFPKSFGNSQCSIKRVQQLKNTYKSCFWIWKKRKKTLKNVAYA